MKKFIVLLVLISLFSSCVPDDNYPRYSLELVPVESVEIPQRFRFGMEYDITLYYHKLSTCHYPNGIYFQRDGNTRTVAVQNMVEDRNNCHTDIPEEDLIKETSFRFLVSQPAGTTYVFKFFKGQNSEGQNEFLVIEVPVEAIEQTP